MNQCPKSNNVACSSGLTTTERNNNNIMGPMACFNEFRESGMESCIRQINKNLENK